MRRKIQYSYYVYEVKHGDVQQIHFMGYDVVHNEFGPAIISPTHKLWVKFGKLHRSDGPAIVNTGLSKVVLFYEYYLHGYHMNDKIYRRWINSWWGKLLIRFGIW